MEEQHVNVSKISPTIHRLHGGTGVLTRCAGLGCAAGAPSPLPLTGNAAIMVHCTYAIGFHWTEIRIGQCWTAPHWYMTLTRPCGMSLNCFISRREIREAVNSNNIVVSYWSTHEARELWSWEKQAWSKSRVEAHPNSRNIILRLAGVGLILLPRVLMLWHM